jgi:hypothetical protein
MTIRINAASRLRASEVEARSTQPPPDTQKERIGRMKKKTGCDDKAARHYLSAEEWDVADAIISYEGDKKAGLHASGMSNADLMKRMVDSASRLMDLAMDDMGMDYEEALKYAKSKSTAGSSVWEAIEKKYKHR